MKWDEKLKCNIPENWISSQINYWLDIKSGFPFQSEQYLNNGRYKVITIKNVQDSCLDTSGCDYLNEIPPKAKEYIRLNIGDILISLTGNCGRVCIVSEKNLLLNQRVGLLSCDTKQREFDENNQKMVS